MGLIPEYLIYLYVLLMKIPDSFVRKALVILKGYIILNAMIVLREKIVAVFLAHQQKSFI